MIATKFAEGMTYREIGEMFFIAPATVRTHLSAIYRKLDVRSKVPSLRCLRIAASKNSTSHHSNALRQTGGGRLSSQFSRLTTSVEKNAGRVSRKGCRRTSSLISPVTPTWA
ncbi:response regulator transcription factor [Mesorhizobium sp. M4B.F.Ca.ET.049.02.1.2]|nr:response regulator transcription factor [Mesorhizobium sp. M4B.F.Ca.ET.049.02.1.2]